MIELLRSCRSTFLRSVLVKLARDTGSLDILIKDLRNWREGPEIKDEESLISSPEVYGFP